MHPDTVARGVREVAGEAEPAARVRAPGGGRKSLAETDPELVRGLQALVDPETRGDPMSLLVWTTKSTRNLAGALTAARASGHGPDGGADAARDWGSACRATPRSPEGRQHADRDAQFGYLNAAGRRACRAGQPVISVDTKKKELVGDYKNGGREYQPARPPERGQRARLPRQGTRQGDPVRHLRRLRQHRLGRRSAPTTTPPRSPLRPSARWWDTVGRHRYPRRRPAADLRRRRRLQRLPGPGLEDRAGQARRRDRPARSPSATSRPAPANGTRSSTGCSPRSP